MRKALVVEDDADIVELVSLYLGKDGWDVESVADGRRALEKVRRGSYQLIILDIQLPGMDGLSVCAELRRDRASASVPLVMLTARGDESDRVVGLEMGADDYVVKPFSPKELLARVRALSAAWSGRTRGTTSPPSGSWKWTARDISSAAREKTFA